MNRSPFCVFFIQKMQAIEFRNFTESRFFFLVIAIPPVDFGIFTVKKTFSLLFASCPFVVTDNFSLFFVWRTISLECPFHAINYQSCWPEPLNLRILDF